MRQQAALLALFVLTLTPTTRAQEPETDPQEIIRQIRRNMVEVEKNMDRLQSEMAIDKGRQVKEDIDRLLKDLKSRGEQISTDIEEVIKNLKLSQGQGQGQSSEPNSEKNQQQSGQPRDRNEASKGQRPKGQNDSKPEGQEENNAQKESQQGRNRDAAKKPDDERKKVLREEADGRWGDLPAEVRQRLIESNFDTFAPEYLNELKAYYRRIAKKNQ